jgi:zinc protease
MLLAVLLAALPPLQLPARSLRLENGLTVIVSPDRSVPGVAVDLRYRVGSKDEDPGRTGFAHLFEHLMFMGARYVPYPKFDTLMEAAGGTNNASTDNDETNYHESGPSNLLETFLWMEADRLATLGKEMTQEKLETQRKIVLNERRQNYENRPYGLAQLALEEHLFPEGHPYHWPVIGSARDIEAAQLGDVTRFFDAWYTPANTVLAIAGDVDAARAFELARKYLSFIPGRPPPKRKEPPPPRLTREDRFTMKDNVELPRLFAAWVTAPRNQRGDADAVLLAAILGRGKASRLYERLVHGEQVAAEVSADQDSRDLAGVFVIDAMARPGHTTAELLRSADEELRRIAQDGPTQAELDSARIRLYADAARSLEDLEQRAARLTRYQVDWSTPDALQRDLGRYEAATRESVRALARQLAGSGRVVVEVVPVADGGAK